MEDHQHGYAPGYSAENDPHLEPNGVLINRLGITTTRELNEAEAEFYVFRSVELSGHPLRGKFDLAHLQGIHRHLFQDVYPWAGEVRRIDITKNTTRFARHEIIESQFADLALQLAARNYLKELPLEQFADRAGYFLGAINMLHPFREGNGRTQREFIHLLARQAGYTIGWESIGKAGMIQACVTAGEGNHDSLAMLLLNLSSLK
jgi:cell filamentation protein